MRIANSERGATHPNMGGNSVSKTYNVFTGAHVVYNEYDSSSEN